MKKSNGFTLIEMMVVIGIIVLLAMLAVPSFFKHSAKAKRTEAYMNLKSLYGALKSYYIEHDNYTDKLTGPDSLQWSPEGKSIYSYGFSGQEGINYIKGKGDKTGIGSQANIGNDSFTVVATADIDGDGKPDIITINDKNIITIVEDDLA